MTLLEHPSLAGNLKQVTAGEWAGPCPWCGGTDRFRVWPSHSSGAVGGRFMCRGCGRRGDGIQFIRDMDGLSYADACRRFGTTPEPTAGASRPVTGHTRQTWTPKASVLPCEVWSARAGQFADRCAAALIAGGPGLDYAASRGLTPKTCAALRIGWNPSDLYEDRVAWGLSIEDNPRTGRPRRIWLPGGLVIPSLRAGHVVSIKIRRSA